MESVRENGSTSFTEQSMTSVSITPCILRDCLGLYKNDFASSMSALALVFGLLNSHATMAVAMLSASIWAMRLLTIRS